MHLTDELVIPDHAYPKDLDDIVVNIFHIFFVVVSVFYPHNIYQVKTSDNGDDGG